MNTARIVVLVIAPGAGGTIACPNERPDTGQGVTGAILQARQTGTQSLTLQSIADDDLAGEIGDAFAEASRASTSRHGPATMLN